MSNSENKKLSKKEGEAKLQAFMDMDNKERAILQSSDLILEIKNLQPKIIIIKN